jgi:hypothetical protein
MQVMSKEDDKEEYTFEPIFEFFLTIASGTTPIGSTGRAPDEDGNIGFTIGVNYRLHHQSDKHQMMKFANSLPSGGIGDYLKKIT